MLLNSTSSNEVYFNVAAIKRCTSAEGPFKRMAIWFQGCDIRCEGCCNPDLIPIKIANKMSLTKLSEIIFSSVNEFDIEGITLLGGEPTIQTNLTILCDKIHSFGLGIILFTGHIFEELSDEIIKSMDLIVDGHFSIKEPENERNLIGSKNQRIIDITGRYTNALNWFYEKREKLIEISLNENIININGDVLERLQ